MVDLIQGKDFVVSAPWLTLVLVVDVVTRAEDRWKVQGGEPLD